MENENDILEPRKDSQKAAVLSVSVHMLGIPVIKCRLNAQSVS